MEKVAIEAQKLKDELAKSIDRDTNAFNALMAANRMPKKTDEQKAERERAIQEATLGAIEVPLSVVRNMVKVMELAKIAAEKGNRNSISDVSTAAAQSRAAAEAAADNVMINVPGLADRKKAKALLEESTKLLTEICKAADEVQPPSRRQGQVNLK